MVALSVRLAARNDPVEVTFIGSKAAKIRFDAASEWVLHGINFLNVSFAGSKWDEALRPRIFSEDEIAARTIDGTAIDHLFHSH